MKKPKFTELQLHKLREAQRNLQDVLREVKAKPLKGEALAAMKTLEDAAVNLECVLVPQ